MKLGATDWFTFCIKVTRHNVTCTQRGSTEPAVRRDMKWRAGEGGMLTAFRQRRVCKEKKMFSICLSRKLPAFLQNGIGVRIGSQQPNPTPRRGLEQGVTVHGSLTTSNIGLTGVKQYLQEAVPSIAFVPFPSQRALFLPALVQGCFFAGLAIS